ncbi:ribosome-binding factor A [bacterium]|jgi:ribosome-binding factor A|nr:ribosome-binding factor A [bacterium]NBX78281.1 ribosome-binding factor A [bacterium]
MNNTVSTIKRAQKEAQILKEISKMLLDISLETPALHDLFVNKVELNSDKSIITVYFYTPAGESVFKEKLKTLILFKPSMRKGLATAMPGRYTPNLKFVFDDKFEKIQRLEGLLAQVKSEDKE